MRRHYRRQALQNYTIRKVPKNCTRKALQTYIQTVVLQEYLKRRSPKSYTRKVQWNYKGRKVLKCSVKLGYGFSVDFKFEGMIVLF